MDKIGRYAFIAGIVIAVLGGLGLQQSWFPAVLAVLGLIVGFMNVTSGEVSKFLLSAIALIVAASAVISVPYLGEAATRIIADVVAFLSAAVLVVALKTVLETAKD